MIWFTEPRNTRQSGAIELVVYSDVRRRITGAKIAGRFANSVFDCAVCSYQGEGKYVGGARNREDAIESA